MREPGPLSLKRLLVPAGWSFGGTASLAAGEQRQERGPRAPGGSVVIWPIAGASGERNLKRRVADGLLHAPCRNAWKQSNSKHSAQLDPPPPKGAKQSKPRGRPRGADVTEPALTRTL